MACLFIVSPALPQQSTQLHNHNAITLLINCTGKQLCFTEDALLVDEFNYIFHDLFKEQRRDVMKKIVTALKNGPLEYNKLAKKINYASGGPLTDYLEELELSGYVTRDYNWDFKNGKESQSSRYRLSDNYLRFYLKYIQPRLNQIKKQRIIDFSLSALPAFDTMIGLQVENLILNNRNAILQELNINPADIINDNPYFQRANSKQQGCQVDYLIQTKFKTIYVIEIKFSREPVTNKVIKEMQNKIKKLKIPRGFACIPVLIVAGDVSVYVFEGGYFYKVIDLRELLNK